MFGSGDHDKWWDDNFYGEDELDDWWNEDFYGEDELDDWWNEDCSSIEIDESQNDQGANRCDDDCDCAGTRICSDSLWCMYAIDENGFEILDENYYGGDDHDNWWVEDEEYYGGDDQDKWWEEEDE